MIESGKQPSELWKELEAMGKCLDHSSIEIIIESRLPVWILDKIYQQKKDQEFWSVARLRKFLQELVQRNGEIQRSQASSSGYQRKSTESKSNHDPRSTRGETSALAVIKQPKPNDSRNDRITNLRKYPESDKIRRPYSFCNENHWDDECQVYQTAKQRMERLKTIEACLNCLQKGHIAQKADVEKVFLQLELHQSDRNCTRFLWTNDIKFAVTEENLKCYRFRRVPFGVISPLLLAATFNHHLETIEGQTALEIRRNLYVDNVILSANGTREAINKDHEVKDIFKKTAMNIRGFLSNNQNFNKVIPKHDRIEGGATKILGITWINDKDTIRITLKPWIEHELTKRSVLHSNYSSKTYGKEIILGIKSSMRMIKKHGDLLQRNGPQTMSRYRGWLQKKLSDQQLHVFTDASCVAYSAAVYILNKHLDERNSAILFAKSKLPPIKGMTIPWLKLLAILTDVRTANFVIKQWSMEKIPMVLRSDPKCALHWIQKSIEITTQIHTKLSRRNTKGKFLISICTK
uniref:Reverse transcriptase domain-containing protein n=1 Tax=Loa loa TaxID=7209 RepID=A0A1I7VVP4_LOALO